ncbi:MAG TPA: PQQ-dependent sugar dehydrogenase [Candidatus Eisenbacteria bacterium]|jgi:glucose/arabinose dehydrogenase|nr:PQQ-dependent sugar dehydrogenase [Candidatus Eisenbacteria bacterium]
MKTGLAVLALALALVSTGACATATEGDRVAARLVVPRGFAVDLFADNLPDVRFLAVGPGGTILATLTRQGRVVELPDANHDGRADRIVSVADGLDLPHGIEFHAGSLWVAETGRVIQFPGYKGGKAGAYRVIVRDLPAGGGHFTRTLTFGPKDGLLYVAVGSSCNLCVEKDRRRAAVLRFQPDGSRGEVFAKGLRNAVGLAWNPANGELWATSNERDMLGDDLPPEEIVDVLKAGGDYGWPYCYGDRIPNPEYHDAARCAMTIPPALTDTAHSAPLGCTFYSGTAFPAEYRGDYFVCYHGSWNRSRPTGYRVVRVRVRDGKPAGIEHFVDGFLPGGREPIGRPVDVLTAPDGSLLVSDDFGGRIFRVHWVGSARR